MIVNADPMHTAMNAQAKLFGKMSFNPGAGSPISELTAVADTEIIAPASTQYRAPFSTL